MTTEVQSYPADDDAHLDIAGILGAVWDRKFTVALVTCLCLAASVAYLNVSEYTYTATLTLIPTQTQNQNISGRLGDLASLAGVNLSKDQTISPYALFPDAIKSRVVADELSQSSDIMQKLFWREWDAGTGKWQEPTSTLHTTANAIKAYLGVPIYPWHPPGAAELQTLIDDRVEVLADPKKSVLTVRFNDRDPAFAASFLQALREATDQVLRRVTLDQATKYSAYLENKLATVQSAELREVLTQTLGSQQTLVMMGSSDVPFAAQPLGPAESSSLPTRPKPSLVLIIGALSGAGLGVLAAILGFPRLRQRPSTKKWRSANL